MFLQMSHRQLLQTGSTLQTRYMVFSDALPPVDWLGWYLWCNRCNATVRVFLCFEGLQSGIGLLKGLVHVLWCETLLVGIAHALPLLRKPPVKVA
jgi:hypothetical protein